MIENTIGEIEAKILGADSVSDEHKHELLQLLAKLKTEIATAQNQNLQPLKHSVEELRTSVEGFEQSHPKLVQTVNSISNTLSNLGI
jgi:cell division septum initiation protein DivIVA